MTMVGLKVCNTLISMTTLTVSRIANCGEDDNDERLLNLDDPLSPLKGVERCRIIFHQTN